MTTLEVRYRDAIHQILVLNKWDIDGYETVRCQDVQFGDVGKLLEFDDGSDWYSPIVAVSGNAVRTQAGLFNKRDPVCLSRVKVPGSQYSGLYRNDQHLLVFPPTRKESERVKLFLAGRFDGKLSKRELMITTEKLQGECAAAGLDENWIVTKLVREADNMGNKGFERLDAIKVLARIMGVEIGGQVFGQQRQVPLFGNVNLLSVQDQRRSETKLQKALKSAIEVVCEVKDSKEEVSVERTAE